MKSVLTAACAVAMALSASLLVAPATAAVTSLPKQVIAQSDAAPQLVQAQRKRIDRRYDRRRGYNRRFVPGRRYGRPPPNWRRYNSRPGNWRTRGCVIVGPLWFCP